MPVAGVDPCALALCRLRGRPGEPRGVPALRQDDPPRRRPEARHRPADRDEPDRRAILRRPELAAVPPLGTALPLVQRAGPETGALAGPTSPPSGRSCARARG